MTAPATLTLEVLGRTDDGRIAFGWAEIPDSLTIDPVLLDEADLGVLVREFERNNLPLWPQRPCVKCGDDAVGRIEGDDLCARDIRAYGAAEDASFEAARGE
ncbi:hypothetical protein [Phycicoccus sp. 3266]|uniref:hypothetical protein n=1 Tax=Phycicoccus sp. 3266 TaxID=2817751 RepID=UPI002863D789|nr:hypothetical protein [Phycicoccus sp. 3266]MDR6861933.1 hypothetical protein [Phycicoccus sp. 3266]